jgi:hypothetical protein
MVQQQLLQQLLALKEKLSMSEMHSIKIIQKTHSSSSALPKPPPRVFLDLVADSTMVNCNKLHDHMPSVKNTKSVSLAIVLSLNESKNSIMSAAVPVEKVI